MWVWASVANRAIIAIQDDSGFTYSSYHTGNSTWQFLTITKATSSITFLIADMFVLTGDTTAYFDGAVLIEGSGYPSSGTLIYSGTGSNYVDTGLVSGTTYYYEAFGYSNGIFSSLGNYLTSTVLVVVIHCH
jgi:hypothetical protein